MNILSEPYGDDTDYEKGGLLLLSYPAIESFTLSNFIEDTYRLQFDLGKHIKTFIGMSENRKKLQLNKITADTLLFAASEFLKYLDVTGIKFDLDDLSSLNQGVFTSEEELHERENVMKYV